MAKKNVAPLPLLDTLEHLSQQPLPDHINLPFASQDFENVKLFLMQYRGSKATFESYRRELERLLQWAWHIAKKSVLTLKRAEIEDYLAFCQTPPKFWIGTKRVGRFIVREGQRIPNLEWRIFVVQRSKSDVKEGKEPDTDRFKLSNQTFSSLFVALGSFYNYLLYEELISASPIAQIRQKSKYLKTQQGQRKVRRLTELQWDFVIETAELMADENPIRHERTLFIITILYLLYLRVSELVATQRWEPQMGHFYQDSQASWWFKTVGKGNKERDISVPNAMLKALERYRKSRQLSPALPLPNEPSPLIHALRGNKAVASDRQIRVIVQECFDKTMERMMSDGFIDEARMLEEATVHWLRHTGISDDINKRGRPVTHVRDDAGHSSSAITDRYNDVELQARHQSAKNKKTKD